MHLLVEICSHCWFRCRYRRAAPQRSCTHNDFKASDADVSDAYLTYHPHYNTQFVGCDSILSLTPQARTWHVFETSALALSRLDPRWEGMHLRFEWDPTGQGEFSHRVMGLQGHPEQSLQHSKQWTSPTSLIGSFIVDQTLRPMASTFSPYFPGFKHGQLPRFVVCLGRQGQYAACISTIKHGRSTTAKISRSRVDLQLLWVQPRQCGKCIRPHEFLKLQNGHPTPCTASNQQRPHAWWPLTRGGEAHHARTHFWAVNGAMPRF